ncbi:MAG: UDP-3-O-[3-hydroxymyristoyl] N-acetylglucosamine deacetylase [Candidatus Nitronauta litoralis]|uniref:UDP-3-O-acyl-N-acetylglucosamine deacetylase n=1 Tax=Candidatus Nitronauta litoralis TaxID=2705533 RepID=A0A7T0BXC7_9BACT|nr:MAG: UDP-3-O-[3-hydroxymyristoyl] N-acetylglucosamine deacetylase [Candidatus Nitronauta litoralis]
MSKPRVLIVDDEKNIVSSLHGILEDEGYRIDTADDGLDALEQVQSDPPDLVLLDIWLPGMDGIEVLKTIKTYHPEIEVLIMSGHGTIDTAVKATKLGAFDFIEKPFSLDQLVQSVDKALKLKQTRVDQGPHNGNSKPELPHCFQIMVDVKKKIKEASRHNHPMLIQGAPGTGKEFVAQAIHMESKNSRLPFMKINCPSRSMTSLQQELFVRKGKSSASTPGDRVVYLKNIEALSPTLQDKLIQALKSEDDAPFLPARVFASTSVDLSRRVERGKFRKELLDILSKNTLEVPPLKNFKDNIPILVKKYFEELAEYGNYTPHSVDDEAMERLVAYDWPGNLKELRDFLDNIARKVHPDDVINIDHLPPPVGLDESEAISTAREKGASRLPRQRTLKRSVVLCGSGLHSGIKTGLIMQPLPPNSGIIFGHISSTATIPAKPENVESTEYSTCIKKGFFSVGTIEHIMAVLHMYRINNLLIKIGDEAPVMDGSAKDFCQLVEDGEFEEQDSPYEELVIDKEYSFGDPKGAHIKIAPCDGFEVSYHMEYPEPIGTMDYTFKYENFEGFKKEIAPARTFGFMEEVAALTKLGFASGGKLDNFIMLGDGKVLNTELRYPDEFARHKILDILGDFYLLGKPIRGKISAHKSGHTQNVGLIKTIQENLPN